MIWNLWPLHSPTQAMVATWYYRFYFMCLLIPAVRFVQVFARVCREAHYAVPPGALKSRRWYWPWMLLIIAGGVTAAEMQGPMYVAFFLSRPVMDRIADAALQDPVNAHELSGQWAGVYRIRSISILDKTVVLYLDGPLRSYGYVRLIGSTPDHVINTEGQEDYPSLRHMLGNWYVMYSDYYYWKDGWS
jgi:hypothetical protein